MGSAISIALRFQEKQNEKGRPQVAKVWRVNFYILTVAVNELVIVGMKTEFCVDTTCRAAAELGYKVWLVEDAHTTMHTPVLQADAIIVHHNRTLNGPFVQGVVTSKCEF